MPTFELEGMPVGFPMFFGTVARLECPLSERERRRRQWAVNELANVIALEQSQQGPRRLLPPSRASFPGG